MNVKLVLVGVSFSALLCARAQAANVALSSDGATFNAASSFIDLSPSIYTGLTINPGGQTTAQNNLITGSPTAWLSNGETRYIFSDTDTTSSISFKLGADYTLTSAGATWFTRSYQDRAPTEFSVAVSDNGTSWTTVATTTALPFGGGGDLLNFAPVTTEYVQYTFGGVGGGPVDGVGIDQVFAGTPEPAAWALMLVGFGALGGALRSRRTARLTA